MRGLVACEYSGRVRDALIRLGHDAVSCDFHPTETPGPHHQGDVRDILGDGWDLLIAHPDCTYLCRAGARWLFDTDSEPGAEVPKGAPRWEALFAAAEFFNELRQAPVPHIAVENPRPYAGAAELIGTPDQVVHPWQFGETQLKATGLWLHNLPELVPTADVYAQTMALPKRERSAVHYAPPGPDRWKDRSRTFQGIADAMAAQWGAHVEAQRVAA